MEYEQGETVEIIVKNNLNSLIKHLKGVGCGLQSFSDGEWKNVSSRSCRWEGEDKLKPDSEYNFDWVSSKWGLEKYRIAFHYQEQELIETKEIGKIICGSEDVSEELEKLLLSGNWIEGNNKGCVSCDACGCSCVAKDVWIVEGAIIDINYVSCGGNSYTIKYKGEGYNCVPENYKPLYEQASIYSKVPENWETIYSNEFTIKEKSALDAKCKDNIFLTWEKFVNGVWTSEDMTRKPRHYTHTNICYEKSNEDIWKLCRNEGCVDYTDTGIEVLCFGSACSPKIDISTKKCYLECPG